MRIALWLLSLLVADVIAAQTPRAPDSADASRAESPEEIVVRGRRRDEIRFEIVRLENAVYERFNALNSTDDFDITCMNEAPAGSRLPVRECLPKFAWTADRRAAQEVLRLMRGEKFSANPQIHYNQMEKRGENLIAEMEQLAREDEQLLRDLTRLFEMRQNFGNKMGKRR